MHLLENIPGSVQDIFATSKNVVRSLACNDLEFPVLEPAPSTSPGLAHPIPLPFKDPIVQVPEEDLGAQESAPKCAPWLLSGMILMGLDSYFPRLSAVSSLWTPLQAVIPVLHWMASWWILPPGWEPNLVSLAPLFHRLYKHRRPLSLSEVWTRDNLFDFGQRLGSCCSFPRL
ncbi:hypothetical protein DSO57_1016196 [Entomophthora muscae]|uniref:Uncharacterized protein n=1 Tax=Entomophthora muscae TaxID=34485 RepID=A0ACC2UF03_9FUNG|nr:hypothetical protein DSO57_1016196 [Entomophthora muscae]